ncbi:phage excisionase [Escherichia coli]|nr:phage excisionase [Escherichia coli]
MIVSPGKWVSEEQLIALKGIKKGTLKVTGSFKPSGLFPPALQK